MTPKDSPYPKDWFRIAEGDLKRARVLFDLDDLLGAAIHIQQGLEKYLKGYLLSKGRPPRRTHDLETLINEAGLHDASFLQHVLPCRKITQYYLEDRYPATAPSILTAQEIKDSLDVARQVVDLIPGNKPQ